MLAGGETGGCVVVAMVRILMVNEDVDVASKLLSECDGGNSRLDLTENPFCIYTDSL